MKRLFYGVTILLGLVLLPRALELTLPFILGFFIYLLCRRSVRRMVRAGLGRTLATGMALAFFLALVGAALALCLAAAYGGAGKLPDLLGRISKMGTDSPMARRLLSSLSSQLADAAKTLALGLLSHMGDLTHILMVLLFAILSAFFFLRDEEKLVDIILQNGGGGLLKNLRGIKATVGNALGGYIRAQAVIMTVIFAVLTVFLVLFGIQRAPLIALGTAFLDAIPVFGTGFVLLPWSVWQFLTGKAALGFGLLALYGVCSLIRQILEPRILSAHIGLHPLLTLTGIFAGYQLLGFPGLVLGPAAVLVIVTYIQKLR